MEITNELLLNKGFVSDHPNHVITSFKLHNNKPEWNISISRQYMPYSNKLIYNCDCWLCNDKGVIIKRASLSNIIDTDELNSIIKLCNINYQI